MTHWRACECTRLYGCTRCCSVRSQALGATAVLAAASRCRFLASLWPLMAPCCRGIFLLRRRAPRCWPLGGALSAGWSPLTLALLAFLVSLGTLPWTHADWDPHFAALVAVGQLVAPLLVVWPSAFSSRAQARPFRSSLLVGGFLAFAGCSPWCWRVLFSAWRLALPRFWGLVSGVLSGPFLLPVVRSPAPSPRSLFFGRGAPAPNPPLPPTNKRLFEHA